MVHGVANSRTRLSNFTKWSSGFPYFLQFKSEFGNKEFMMWATVCSRSCVCWLHRDSPSLAAKNIISLISVLTIWWCPHVESSLVSLEDGVCCDQSHSKVMVEVLQARLQQYMNCELPDVQAGFGKGRGTRNRNANICWIIEKAREFQKNIYFCFIDYAKAFDCVDHNKLETSSRDRNTIPPDLPPEKSVCRSRSNS